jgi:hypothetical protein
MMVYVLINSNSEPCLNRRTFYRRITTKHTTISLLWFENGFAICALIEKCTCIRWHNFCLIVIFTVEDEKQILEKTGKQIGIDVGIESFATLSDGTQGLGN